MEPKRILVTRQFPEAGTDLLADKGFHLTFWPEDRPMTAEELVRQAQGHQALLCTLTDRIDRTFLTANPQLEMVSQFAVGYDNIDVAAATDLGIPVGFTPDAMSEATADIAFGLMIAASRKMFFLHKTILAGQWGHFRPKGNLGVELKGKTLGILGLGRIGLKMAERCRAAYGMTIIYHNRNQNPEAEKALAAQWVDFDTLLAHSDVLSAHCVLSPDTCGIFNARAFRRMKPSAIFINTARGPVHNETDLIQALETGAIWGAGLDVTDPEPMDPANPLLAMENVAVLPHVGSGTQEARDEMSRLAAQNLIAFFTTGKVPHIVNPEVIGT